MTDGLPLMESFYSIQGEGFYSGRPAFFIRLGGCDVGCYWCDVKESWDAEKHDVNTVEEILNKVKKTDAKFVVITGGEPAMYNLTNLTQKLKKQNYYIAIETSGVYKIEGNIDWICFSPKKFKQPHLETYSIANEIKVIVCNKHDLIWAEEHADKLNKNCKLYLQPEWDKREKILPIIMEYIKKNPKWNLSLQTHKYINVP